MKFIGVERIAARVRNKRSPRKEKGEETRIRAGKERRWVSAAVDL